MLAKTGGYGLGLHLHPRANPGLAGPQIDRHDSKDQQNLPEAVSGMKPGSGGFRYCVHLERLPRIPLSISSVSALSGSRS
jgi:hypothetical protein